MAKRIVFMKNNTAPFNEELEVEFTWAQGLNTICRQRSIHNLFDKAGRVYPCIRILDTSYVSDQQEGGMLSSFNLPITLASGETVPLECAYQGSKMIDHAGPYKELFHADPMKVKTEACLNGEVTGFRFEGVDYAAASPHAFYNWLFCRALHQNQELAEQLEKYDAFCDIMNRPDAEECEARAVAVYEGLRISNKLSACLDSYDVFCDAMNGLEIAVPLEAEEATTDEDVEDTNLESDDIGAESDAVNQETVIDNGEDEQIAPVNVDETETEVADKKFAGANPEPPMVELFGKILASPGLCKLLASVGKAFGFSGSVRERIEAARKHLTIAYQNALQMGTLAPERGGLAFTADNLVTVNLVPNVDFPGGWRLYFHTDMSQVHKNIAQIPVAIKPEVTPADYLKSRGFNVVSESAPQLAFNVKLAQQMKEVCASEVGSGFFENLRKYMGKVENPYYTFSNSVSEDDKKNLCDLLVKMKKIGLLRDVNYSKSNCIRYMVPDMANIRQFLLGGWLETAFLADVERIVREYAVAYDLPVHIGGNLKLEQVSDPGVVTHELDVAFSIADLFFVCEAKSGQADYDRFRIVGCDLDILPDRLLLVNSSLTREEAEAVEWWYPYHVASGADLETALRSMIEDVLDKAGYVPVKDAPADAHEDSKAA